MYAAVAGQYSQTCLNRHLKVVVACCKQPVLTLPFNQCMNEPII